MTDLSRGARVRRGGRRPGWVLLTALLVLAIGASSALVFTNKVELLKLAVILALWAAVVAAFVSVIYRRQSDVDQARARDLKLVYDLQLDREISARREYELTVESQLRRELASELRAQAYDEVSALRAELAALRTNLEILFDAELSDRPALETERKTVRGYSDWERENESARERVNRVASVRAEEPRRGASTIRSSTCTRSRWSPLRRGRPAESLSPGVCPPQQPADAYAPRVGRTGPPRRTQAPEPERGAHWRQEAKPRATRRSVGMLGAAPPPRRPPAAERQQEGQQLGRSPIGSPSPAVGTRRRHRPQPGPSDSSRSHRDVHTGGPSRRRGPSRSSPRRLRSQRRNHSPSRIAAAADSLAAARGGAPPAGAAGLAAGQFRGTMVAARGARQQLELRPGRQRRLGAVGVRQRAVTRQGKVAPRTERRRTDGAAVLAG